MGNFSLEHVLMGNYIFFLFLLTVYSVLGFPSLPDLYFPHSLILLLILLNEQNMDSFGNHASLRTTIARLNTPTTTFSTESTPVHSSLPMEGSPIPNIPIRSTPPNSATQSNEVVLPTTVTENNQYPTLVRWWQSRTTLGTLGATVRPGPGNSTAAQQQLSITTVGATAAQGIRIPVRSTVPTTVGVLGNSSSNATNVARNLMHPQFRSKPVCELHCSHCSTPVCERAMRAVLLADVSVELFSTDTPLSSAAQLVGDPRVTDRCACEIHDLACLTCGNVIGYTVVGPCPKCLGSCNNGHRTMFTDAAVSDELPVTWGDLQAVSAKENGTGGGVHGRTARRLLGMAGGSQLIGGMMCR